MKAASIKAQFPVSYADSFAAACAEEEEAILVTGDMDFRALEKRVEIYWLR